MSIMTANRYLLNNSPQMAIELYRKALEDEQESSGARCHLIVACLKAGRANEAVAEILWLIDRFGADALKQLPERCRGFLADRLPADSKERAIQSGLRHLMHGRWEHALRDLRSETRYASDELTRLIGWLQERIQTRSAAARANPDMDPTSE